MNCNNCFSESNGNYCFNCGQKSGEAKFTMKSMVLDLVFSAFHLEKKGLLFTLRELTFRPGDSIKKYIKGQRQYLYPPFKYLVLMGTIVIILSLRYNFFHNEYTQVESVGSFQNLFFLSENYVTYLDHFFIFAEDEATLLNIITIPVFAFFSWSLLSKGKFNFAENLIINTYITSQQLIFLVVLIPFIEFIPGAKIYFIQVYSMVTVGYNIWVYVQFYGGHKFRQLPQASIAVLVSYVYQFPVNLAAYHLYETYLHGSVHWVPDVIK
jgi:hypothetical protein